jgi:hypothetical protein
MYVIRNECNCATIRTCVKRKVYKKVQNFQCKEASTQIFAQVRVSTLIGKIRRAHVRRGAVQVVRSRLQRLSELYRPEHSAAAANSDTSVLTEGILCRRKQCR